MHSPKISTGAQSVLVHSLKVSLPAQSLLNAHVQKLSTAVQSMLVHSTKISTTVQNYRTNAFTAFAAFCISAQEGTVVSNLLKTMLITVVCLKLNN